MTKNLETVTSIWRSHNHYLAKSSTHLNDIAIADHLASVFCPGPSYYYVIDSPTLTLDMVSNSVKDILGIPAAEFNLERFMGLVHPGDTDFLFRCEDLVAYFLKNSIPAAAVTHYKITYCIRLQVKKGNYRLFLMQTTTLKATQEGSLLKVFGVQTDISHITDQTKRTLSIIGLHGEPSYLDIDVYNTQEFKDFTPYHYPEIKSPFSTRESQVLRLLIEGLSTAAIAEQLHISSETVSTHRKNILRKAKVRNTAELIATCVMQGLV